MHDFDTPSGLSSAPVASATPAGRASGFAPRVLRERIVAYVLAHRDELAMLLALVTMCLILSRASKYFATANNFYNIEQQASALGVLSIGQLIVILTGGIDLSVGSVVGLSGFLGGITLLHYGVAPGIAVAIATGVLCGTVNGILVAFAELSPFIVTFGMLSVARSLTYVIGGAQSVSGFPPSFASINADSFLGVPIYIIIVGAVFICGYILLAHLRSGRFFYAIGSNAEAARLSGVNVRLYRMLAYVVSGFLAGIAAIMIASQLMAVEPQSGTGLELNTIAAVVVGGASLFGGKGSVFGVLIGVLLLTVLSNAMDILNVNPYWQGTASGTIVVLALAVERVTRRKAR